MRGENACPPFPTEIVYITADREAHCCTGTLIWRTNSFAPFSFDARPLFVALSGPRAACERWAGERYDAGRATSRAGRRIAAISLDECPGAVLYSYKVTYRLPLTPMPSDRAPVERVPGDRSHSRYNTRFRCSFLIGTFHSMTRPIDSLFKIVSFRLFCS